MVQAIIEGRKTQTRRVIKSSLEDMDEDNWPMGCDADGLWHRERCQFGNIGDHLWVKETWGIANDLAPDINLPPMVSYKASDTTGGWATGRLNKWRSPMFMPRRFSRITLEITNIRVKRLQDISNKDALAEGIENFFGVTYSGRFPPADGRLRFSEMLESTKGKGSWAANPWVWVIEFKRCGEV